MLTLLLTDRSWNEIPAVKLAGLALGVAFMFIAIRALFGKKY
jgi:hypothetical protein